MDIHISDDDILYAEKLLLPKGCSFNEERRCFIRSMETRDVVACPGSGKTTAILAKILILARKMPFSDGRGICVLTHTNVAIDLIKERAGAAASTLFQYPNYFGTIQSFVNKFLAIPCYRDLYTRSISAIDNERYYRELKKLYSPDISPWLEPRGGLSKLAGYWFHPDTFIVGESITEPINKLKDNSPTYKKIQKIRKRVLENGILSYHDAYSLALRQIKRNANISSAFANRFAIVLVDEAQDTKDYQFAVLNSVLIHDQVIFQNIGDPNQAIFDGDKNSETWKPKSPLHICHCRRYVQTITKILDSVRLYDDIVLGHCDTTASLEPHCILFNDGEETNVLHAFSCLLHAKSGEMPSNGTFCAVGWVAKANPVENKLSLPSYYPAYENKILTHNPDFANLVSCAAFALQKAKTENINVFFSTILSGITHALDRNDIKDQTTGRRFTEPTLKRYLLNSHKPEYSWLRRRTTEYYLLARYKTVPPLLVRDKLKLLIERIWSFPENNRDFLDEDTVRIVNTDGQKRNIKPNTYVSDLGLAVNVGTVHSVKGETHTATLYLETSYQGSTDSIRLIDFLKGNRPKELLKKAYHQQNLKMAHVAFSRPTHLLAFACNALTMAGHEDELKANGWVIETVSHLLAD